MCAMVGVGGAIFYRPKDKAVRLAGQPQTLLTGDLPLVCCSKLGPLLRGRKFSCAFVHHMLSRTLVAWLSVAPQAQKDSTCSAHALSCTVAPIVCCHRTIHRTGLAVLVPVAHNVAQQETFQRSHP